MKQLFLFSILMMIGLPQSALANKIIGNGAMVVYCDKESGEPEVRLLDIYETEDIYSAPFLPVLTLSKHKNEDYVVIFHAIVSRISKRFPDLSRQILEEYANFTAHTAYKKKKKLPTTADDYHTDLPIGCELKQLAVQREPMFLRRPWFTVAAEYWDKMDEFNKAATVLHETVYRIGVANGLEHSLGIRYLVGLLVANEINTIGDQDWIDAFTQSRIRNFEIGSLKIPLFTGQFLPCKPSPGTVVCTRSENLKEASLRYNSDRRIQQVSYRNEEETIEFSTYGNVKGALTVKEMRFDWSRPHVQLSSEGGTMRLTSPDTQMTVMFQSAQIQPHEGLFNGTHSVLVGNEMNVETVEFEGPLTEILAKYGVNSAAYSAPNYDVEISRKGFSLRESPASDLTVP